MTSLTTVQGEMFVEPLENLTEAMNSTSNGKVNAVVGKLVKNWRQLYRSESNVHLFSDLLSKNICTRDIHSFLTKQASLRKVHNNLDKPMSRAAMRAKLNDACSFSYRKKRDVNRIKRELFEATGRKRYLQRKILKQVRSKLLAEKVEQSKINETKVQRYLKLQSQMEEDIQNSPFLVPTVIKEYKGIKAFSKPEALSESTEPPMVYDECIKLTEDEIAVLSKGPGFAVRQKLVEENFKIELEKMICKSKYNSMNGLDMDSMISRDEKSVSLPSRANTLQDSRSMIHSNLPSRANDSSRCEKSSSNLPSKADSSNVGFPAKTSNKFKFQNTTMQWGSN